MAMALPTGALVHENSPAGSRYPAGLCVGRGDRTRTYDLLTPSQTRYQTAPRPVRCFADRPRPGGRGRNPGVYGKALPATSPAAGFPRLPGRAPDRSPAAPWNGERGVREDRRVASEADRIRGSGGGSRSDGFAARGGGR